ncbi:hypothetical protein V6N13_097804 [Hibiscus sabdariffa]
MEDAQDEFVFEEDEGLTLGHAAIAAEVHEERFNLRSRGSTQEKRDGSSSQSLRQEDEDVVELEEDNEGYHSLDGDDIEVNLV